MGQVFPLREFKGYSPALDPRRMPSPDIITGNNFFQGVDGPVSFFGGHFFDWRLWDAATSANVRELQVGLEIWYGTPTGVWRIDPISLLPELMIDVVSTRPYWPWSVAEIGGFWYFTQYNVGLYQYNPITNAMAQITTPFGIIKGLCASYGRLVVIDDTNVGWSALDNGTDFTPSTLTGAGAQQLAILSKNAFRVDPIVDGVIVSTDLGLIKGQRVDSDYSFSWLIVSNEIRIFSPNMGIYVPDFGYLTISSAGLHLTNVRTNYFSPQASQPYEPLMSEYLRTQFVTKADKTKDAVISLYYSASMRMVFVAIAPNASQGNYQTTYFFYLPSGKWGVLNRLHTGIVDFVLSPTQQVVGGYMMPSGYFKWFDQIAFDEVLPTPPYCLDQYVWRMSNDPKMQPVISTGGATVYVARSTMQFSNDPPVEFINIMNSGVYTKNAVVSSDETIQDQGDIPTVQDGFGVWVAQVNIDFFIDGVVLLYAVGYAMPEIDLGSLIQIGPVRATEAKEADETSMISSLLLGTTQAVITGFSEDFNTETPDTDEDFSTETPDSYEDYGDTAGIGNSFAASLLASDDGVTPQVQGWENLVIAENLGASIEYAPAGFSAIYHVLQLATQAAGDYFAVKLLDVSAMPTGRHF